MLIYSVLFALYLGYLGTFWQMGGLLLPGIVLHAVMALLLTGSARRAMSQEDKHLEQAEKARRQ